MPVDLGIYENLAQDLDSLEDGEDDELGRLMNAAARRLREADRLLRRTLPMLCRLGDFVGNGPLDPTHPDSLGERCDLIGDIKRSLNPGADVPFCPPSNGLCRFHYGDGWRES